ncbi:MAG: hypothetical protein ABI632_02660 [Pseudolysinimonas sp.]
MRLTAPTFATNGSSQGVVYYAIAKWTYTNPPSVPSIGCVVNVGGRDGFGISLSKQVINLGQSLVACSQLLSCSSTLGSLSSNNAFGAGYTLQDNTSGNVHGPIDNNYTGTLILSYKRLTDGCLQAFARYAHTWSTTAITGFGVGQWAFSISWSNPSHHWDLASAGGRTQC